MVIVRPFNTYGPRQSARAVIPTIITQIAKGSRDIRLGSVSPTRDFNYVADTVRGFEAVLKSSAGLGEVVNLGSNFEISVGDTVNLIAEVMEQKVNLVTDEIRIRPGKSEVERLWADNSKAFELFGWKPEYGGREGLKQGIKKTVDWFMDLGNLNKYRADIYNV